MPFHEWRSKHRSHRSCAKSPSWPRKTWCLNLIDLPVDCSLSLPLHPDLLKQPISGEQHPHLSSLHWTAWPLSGIRSSCGPFGARCLSHRKQQEETDSGYYYSHLTGFNKSHFITRLKLAGFLIAPFDKGRLISTIRGCLALATVHIGGSSGSSSASLDYLLRARLYRD